MSTPNDIPAGAVTILAFDHWRDSDPIVDSADRLAEAVLAALRSGVSVRVSLKGLRGITSSYANLLLGRVADEFGPAAIRDRMVFITDSDTQRRVLDRSLEAMEQVR